jgi:predicted AAA+ superfamily ATPase
MFYRHITKALQNRYEFSRSVYIFGPRQSGKTTLARQTFPNLPYVSLEDPDVLEFSISDPRGFFNQFTSTLGGIIDEPQRNPQLLSYLQGQIDEQKLKFILTSSQNFLMMDAMAQSLAGRISILTLLPLSKQEIYKRPLVDLSQMLNAILKNNKFNNIDYIWHSILNGGYPEVITTPQVFPYWFSDYIKTYIERDVRRIINIQDLNTFQRFVKLCAGRTGGILNKASLASDCGISETTCTKWLSVLEQSGIIFLLKPYHSNFNKRQTKSPKLHFIDTGLCCSLLGIRTVDHLTTHPLMGLIVESYVVAELYKQCFNCGEDPAFYYWHEQHEREIDLIIELANGEIIPIEIKTGQTITKDMLSPINKWCDMTNSTNGILLYGGNDLQVRSNVTVIPLAAFL